MTSDTLAVAGPILRPGSDLTSVSAELLIDSLGRVTDRPEGLVRRRRLPTGAVAIPGFVDPHVHLLAAAARLLSVDVSAAADISEVLEGIATALRSERVPEWLRVVGYDEAFMPDRRVLSRQDLDAVSPNRPVVVHHRSGAQVICNSVAMGQLGVLDPPVPSAVDVDENGLPTGRITHGHDLLEDVPRLPERSLREAVGDVSAIMLSRGITTITDATHTNGLAELETLADLQRSGNLAQRLEVMVGAATIDDVREAGVSYGDDLGGTTVGHVKLIPEARGAPDVCDLVEGAHRSGWPTATHVLDVAPLEAVLQALRDAPAPARGSARLEHLALATPDQVRAIAALGAVVVTNPSFLLYRGSKYEREHTPVEFDWLYRMGSLRRAGIAVAASSDVPVVPARPLEIAAAAVVREEPRTSAGSPERVTVDEALAAVTRVPGALVHHASGRLAVGDPADFVVLAADPRQVPTDEIADIEVLEVHLAGRRVA